MHVKCKAHTEILINMATTTIFVKDLPRTLTKVGETVLGASSSVARVMDSIDRAARKCGRTTPLLVGASKKQPVMKIQWAYNQGLRHFGENYVQELESKARYLHNHTNCTDIKWHFIGHLQSKKAKLLTNIPGMWMVETLDSLKLASKLNSYWGLRENGSHSLKVLVQVNTSNEESKHGCMPEESVDLVQYVMENCENLDFKGLMTIGQMGHSYDERGSNPDFLRLVDCHDKVKKLLKIHQPLELSMGMSGDYEHAIEHGSTSVRVGTALFGPRDD